MKTPTKKSLFSQALSRRDFLKLASLGALSVAAAAHSRQGLGAGKVSGRRSLLRPVAPTEVDVLNAQQKRQLLLASRHFLAADEEQANRVALEIDFIEGLNEHSSNMCGPLSISILQRAELLGNWVEPRDFWLLNPREDLRSAANAFPGDLYDWHHFESPISSFDFARFPLQTGDLLYLNAGSGDTFEHILVVNRVDHAGRTYSVTNFFTDAGTIIEERMLYDPGRPGWGQFHKWANRKYRNTIGITGSGGFRVWRVREGRQLQFPEDAYSAAVRQSLDKTLLSGSGNWFAAFKEIGGPLLYQFNPYESFHPASTIKVAVAMAFFAWVEQRQEKDVEGYLNTRGTSGRSYAQLLRGMIVESEEDATEVLENFLGAEQIEARLNDWGLDKLGIGPRRSNATQVISLLEGLYSDQWLSKQSGAYLLDLMAVYTSNDETRIGIIRDQLPTNSVIYNKRGSLVEAPRVVADSGIINLPASGGEPERAIAFSIHGLGKDGSSYEVLEAKLDEAILDFALLISSA